MIIPSWTGTWLIQCCVLEKPIETPVRAILGVRHHNIPLFIIIWLFGLSPIGLDELFPLGVSISCATILSTGKPNYTPVHCRRVDNNKKFKIQNFVKNPTILHIALQVRWTAWTLQHKRGSCVAWCLGALDVQNQVHYFFFLQIFFWFQPFENVIISVPQISRECTRVLQSICRG